MSHSFNIGDVIYYPCQNYLERTGGKLFNCYMITSCVPDDRYFAEHVLTGELVKGTNIDAMLIARGFEKLTKNALIHLRVNGKITAEEFSTVMKLYDDI